MDRVINMMKTIINEVNTDQETGVARYLQSNPYVSLPFYNYNNAITPELFEASLYCESTESLRYKEYLCNSLDNSHGKNTFFLLGYQGCGKTTFINSVYNYYKSKHDVQNLVVDCDKTGVGNSYERIKVVFSSHLLQQIKNSEKYYNFLDFFSANLSVILKLPNATALLGFYELIEKLSIENSGACDLPMSVQIKHHKELSQHIDDFLKLEDILYLLVLWKLSDSYCNTDGFEQKLIIIIDNLEYIDSYDDLAEFVVAVDSFTINFSEYFSNIKLFKDNDIKYDYTEKIKLLIAMRETTKANLPSSHFSDAFQSIYRIYDMTEWYDKSKIVEHRIEKLKQYDSEQSISENVKRIINVLSDITKDSYTRNVIYPLFNNNYRSMISMLSKIVVEHKKLFDTYDKLMKIEDTTFRHGARGVLFKLIFDEFNRSYGNEESCFKKIGVLDLLNRRNNDVSICRLLLSYLSNYTETKCDSAKNSIRLDDLLNDFSCIFEKQDILKSLCSMFELRDTHWTHLVSFNQIGYKRNATSSALGKIDFRKLDPEETMLHYSCAGKIYIEYVTTHFEFFTTRIYATSVSPLFCAENLRKDTNGEFKFYDIINRVYNEVSQCCNSLRIFNNKLCKANNYPSPYEDPELYKKSHYICQFKRKGIDGEDERRFKQYHEDRMVNSHIVYIDKFRLYVLNHCDMIKEEEKPLINIRLVSCIKSYVELLNNNNLLKMERSKNKLLPHYNNTIKEIEKHPENYTLEIAYND